MPVGPASTNRSVCAGAATSLAALLVLSACTLTDEGFEPARLLGPPDTAEAEAADLEAAEPPPFQPSAPVPPESGEVEPAVELECAANSELPSCATA
jgi:hypothetical protein